ncbi:MAG: hypothetical protein IJ679_01340 [Lachnospiraceae bacterium]|nr:hypothetical protein [Lachnospiraceae bacterium]
MRSKKKWVILLCCFSLMVSVGAFYASQSGLTPKSTVHAAPLVRIGFAQTREYGSFSQVLLETARELVEAGCISEAFLDKYEGVNYEMHFKEGDTKKLWKDICDAAVEGAPYRFARDAFFDMNEMSKEEYPRMVNRNDVDITFTMGTDPSVYFFEHEKKNKFMSLYTADPIKSGIVKSTTERYTDNSYALMDLTPYLRQLDAGYKFLQFKKLGVVYEDSEAAYDYSDIKEIEQKAEEHGFEVVYEHVDEPVSEEDFDRYYEELKQAYRNLAAKGIDCLYITISSINYEEKMQELLDDAIIPAGIKTMAQDDLAPLAYGVLFGVTISDAKEVAAYVFAQIKSYAEEGVPFDELDMVYECTPKIGINYTTAKRIHFNLPFEDMQIVDVIYKDE